MFPNTLKGKSLKYFILIFLMLPINLFADPKTFLVTVPLLTLGRDGSFRGEYNLFQKGTVALEWTEWGGNGKGEELTETERKEAPESSLKTDGRELGLMFGRYGDPLKMAGFHWGLGAGFRSLDAFWRKAPENEAGEKMTLYDLRVAGATVTGRVGYRFVGEDLGFAIGSFLSVKHFQNKVSDKKSEDTANAVPIVQSDRLALQRRLMSSLRIGIEVGWAF
ncbi:MAG: hypothetical protein HYW48_07555 [Deltaproteobacteria bacterium]|nr:hypothetical protein [Deltaproteobacteria bacterium]